MCIDVSFVRSLPREIVFNTDGSLSFQPTAEVSLARDQHFQVSITQPSDTSCLPPLASYHMLLLQYTGISVEDGSYDVGAVASNQFNMHLNVEVGGIGSANDTASFEVELLRSPDGRETTVLSIQPVGA